MWHTVASFSLRNEKKNHPGSKEWWTPQLMHIGFIRELSEPSIIAEDEGKYQWTWSLWVTKEMKCKNRRRWPWKIAGTSHNVFSLHNDCLLMQDHSLIMDDRSGSSKKLVITTMDRFLTFMRTKKWLTYYNPGMNPTLLRHFLRALKKYTEIFLLHKKL